MGAVRNVGTLGVLLAVTAAIRAFERWHLSRGFSKSKLILSLAMSTISLAVGWLLVKIGQGLKLPGKFEITGPAHR